MAFESDTVTFEQFMLEDDRNNYPMSIFLSTEFTGNVQATVLKHALDEALRRHPLLRSRIIGSPLSQSRWAESVDSMPFVDCAPHGVPMNYPEGKGPRIDLQHENGLRVWVRTSENHVSMSFQFHHACCDALGAMQFLEDWFMVYDHHVHGGSGPPPLKELSHELFATRARFGLSPFEKFCRFPIDVWGVLVGLGVLLVTRPVPITASKNLSSGDPDSSNKFPTLMTHTFDDSTFNTLLLVSRAQHVTLNDLTISHLFCVLRDWNEQQEMGSGKPCLRIIVPMSLRRPGQKPIPAMNYVGMVNLDRRGGRIKSPSTLLKGISQEMRLLKWFRLGMLFSTCYKVLAMVPGGIRLMLPLERCGATTILSNFGRAFEGWTLKKQNGHIVVGDMILQSITGAPPLRPWVRATFTLLSYAGKLTLAMHYDQTILCRADAETLLEAYVHQLSPVLPKDSGSTTPSFNR